jgi:clan AA aspartic protease
MGEIRAELELINVDDVNRVRRAEIDMDEIKKIRITALVDTGATLMVINENIQEYLQLPILSQKPFEMANGEIIRCDVVGSLEIRFANRRVAATAVVMPDNSEPLLGVIPMEEMDVIIDPLRQELVVNPKHPDYAVHRL